MQTTTDSLKAFVKAVKKRPDVRLDAAVLGRKAPKTLLKTATDHLGAVLDGELLEFYAAMNGAEIRWSFIEGPGGGALEIPPLSAERLFQADDQHHMGFGEGKEALLLDGFGDSNTWIVRDAGNAHAGALVFAWAAEGASGIALGSSLSDYLTSAMDNGLVVTWPACTGDEDSASDAHKSIQRFKAPPVEPSEIRPGVRAQTRAFENQGRGEVLDVMTIQSGVLASYESHLGLRFAKVRLDVGVSAWMPTAAMTGLKKPDAYEKLRGNVEGDDLQALLENIACAVGPSGSVSGDFGRENATRGAGLLGAYSLHDAFCRVFDLYDAVLASDLELETDISLEARKKDFFLAKDFRTRKAFRPAEPLTGLVNGFRLLLSDAAHRAETTPGALLTRSMIERLRGYDRPGSKSLFEEVRALRDGLDSDARPVRWATNDRAVAAKLDLGDEALFVG